MRKTHATIAVAIALLNDPGGRHWGYELSKAAGVRSGVMYPVLRRMLDEGWLVDGWEQGDETGGKRPARRYYTITAPGRRELEKLLSSARTDVRFRGIVPGWAI